MRVAHLLPFGIVGGAEIATARLVARLASRGIENVVYVPSDGQEVARLFEDHTEASCSWAQPGPWLSEIGEFGGETLRLAKQFNRQKVDVVHCSKLTAAKSVGAVAGKLAGRPVVVTVHLPSADVHPRVRRLLRFVDQFVFVSRRACDESSFGDVSGKSTVIHNGISEREVRAAVEGKANFRSEFGIRADVFLLTMVARLSPQKDFATLAEAMGRVLNVRPKARLCVVGDGPREHARRVRAEFEGHSVSESVIFAGFRDEALAVMRDSDAVVLSTHSEGLPLVLLEAMALSRPVVATAVGGIPELVEDGATGILVDHQDGEGLADAILRLIEQPDWARKLGRNGRARVRERFSLRKQATRMLEVYDEVRR